MSSFMAGGCLLNDGRVFFAPGQYTVKYSGIYDPTDQTFLKLPYKVKSSADTYPFVDTILLADGNVLLVPGYFDYVIVFNPLTNMVVKKVALSATTNYQFHGAILHPNGKVYLTPRVANNLGIYDPATNTYSLSADLSTVTSDFRGAVLLDDGNILLVPFNSDYVKIYNPTTNVVTTGPLATTTNSAFMGGVLMGNGKVCFVPNAYGKIGVYDPATNTYADGPAVASASFSGAVNLDDGRVFFAPDDYGYVGLYDPVTNTYEDGIAIAGSDKSRGCVKISNGRVIIVPYSLDNVLIYDPITNSYDTGPESSLTGNEFSTIAGSGTIDDPFLIENIHHLFIIEEIYINACYFKQTEDIELGMYGTWWGIYDIWDEFQGYYDGDGHCINNMMTYYATSSLRGGFFGAVGGNAEIKNLNITNAIANYSVNTECVGIMTSDARGATFENCHIDCVINQTSNSYAVAGFVGKAEKSRFYNCSVSVVINSSVNSSENAGFVGEPTDCDFNFCHSNITMIAAATRHAGCAGFCYWLYGDSRVEQCSATGSITGDVGFTESSAFIDWVSDVVDGVATGAILIKDCFANVDIVQNAAGAIVGDIAGFIGTLASRSGWTVDVENCYSSGNFPDNTVDGFISFSVEAGVGITLTGNFYDGTKNLGVSSIYASATSTANMKLQATFTNWDFVDVWLVAGDYPEFIGYVAWALEADPILPVTRKKHLGGVYATVATVIGKIGIVATDVFYASDGFIYIASATKIYKTNLAFTTLVEMLLAGNLDVSFSSFAEAKDGIIVIGDDSMFWTKSKNYNQFGQAESIGYNNANGANAGNPDDYNICSLADTAYAESNWVFDIRNGIEPASYYSILGSFTGKPTQKPVYDEDAGYFVLTCSFYNPKYAAAICASNLFDSYRIDYSDLLITQSTQQPALLKHSNGDVYGILRGVVGDELFFIKSTKFHAHDFVFGTELYDFGLRFEEVGLYRGLFELPDNEFLILHNNKIYTTDFKTHLTKTQELDGNDILCTCVVDGYGVIIITNGSTNNVYIMPYEKNRITQPVGIPTSVASKIMDANTGFESIRTAIETQGVDSEDLPIEHFPTLIREIV